MAGCLTILTNEDQAGWVERNRAETRFMIYEVESLLQFPRRQKRVYVDRQLIATKWWPVDGEVEEMVRKAVVVVGKRKVTMRQRK